MIKLTSTDGDARYVETFDTMDALQTDLGATAATEYTESVLEQLQGGTVAIVINGNFIDTYEILPDE